MCPNAMYYLRCYCDNIYYIYLYYNPACMIEVYTYINVSKFSFLDRFVDLFFVVTKLMPCIRSGEENAPYNAAVLSPANK